MPKRAEGSLSVREMEEIEQRFKEGSITDEDIHLLISTVRGLLEKRTRKSKPKGTPQDEQTSAILEASCTDRVEIFADGACTGNPGPGGWGALLRAGSVTREMFGGERQTTNNRMEMRAVIEALKTLPPASRATVTTDSQYVHKGITQWIHNWKRNGWKNAGKEPVKNADLWRELDELNQKHNIQWCWVRGHNGHPENERCDALARSAIGNSARQRRAD